MGNPLPSVIPPGPDNPLGHRVLKLEMPGYLIHGTNQPYGVGMRVSHGCVRLYPENIEYLYEIVDVGEPWRSSMSLFCSVSWMASGISKVTRHSKTTK